MRRIAALLAPLLLLLLPATAYAGMHIGGSPGLGLLMLILVTLVLAWLIMSLLGAAFWCALFVAVAGVAAMIVIGEYALNFTFPGVTQATLPEHYVLLFVAGIITLAVMVFWGAMCCLNKRISWVDALKIAIIPVLLVVLYAIVF